jgi:hypothetical protein
MSVLRQHCVVLGTFFYVPLKGVWGGIGDFWGTWLLVPFQVTIFVGLPITYTVTGGESLKKVGCQTPHRSNQLVSHVLHERITVSVRMRQTFCLSRDALRFRSFCPFLLGSVMDADRQV